MRKGQITDLPGGGKGIIVETGTGEDGRQWGHAVPLPGPFVLLTEDDPAPAVPSV